MNGVSVLARLIVCSALAAGAMFVPAIASGQTAATSQPAAAPVAAPPLRSLTVIAPAAPGGGWDQLAREMQRHMDRQRIAAAVQVENIPGAAGTIGLAQMISGRRGDGSTLLVNGLVMLGAILWNQSPVSIAQTTPIARLTGEYEIVAVPADSPHRDMHSLVSALRVNPAAVSWAGGSAGGTDHILAGLIVSAAGIDPRRTNYIAFSGGGEAVTALLGGQVTAGISGYSEFAQHVESGRLRAIAISAGARVPGFDIAPLKEQGLDVELANWRAVVAPPGLDAAQQEALVQAVDRMAHSDAWRATLRRLGWTDAYLSGRDFEDFLDEERIRIGRIVARLRGSGADGTQSRAGEWLFPAAVLLTAAIVLAMLVVRGSRPGGSAPPSNRRAVQILAASLAIFVAVLDGAGFIAAGTALFVATASSCGSRRPGRDALIGLALCAGVYITFTRGLGVALPGGAWLGR